MTEKEDHMTNKTVTHLCEVILDALNALKDAIDQRDEQRKVFVTTRSLAVERLEEIRRLRKALVQEKREREEDRIYAREMLRGLEAKLEVDCKLRGRDQSIEDLLRERRKIEGPRHEIQNCMKHRCTKPPRSVESGGPPILM